MAGIDGLGIDGNREVFAELVKLLRTKKAIGFVGAGASAPLYPLWTELVQRLADRAVATRRADARKRAFWRKQAGKRPDQVAKQIRDTLDSGDYSQAMREIFGPRTGDDGRRFTTTHAALVQLPFQGFVTTNYDPGLEKACLEVGRDREAVAFTWDDDRVALWLRETTADPRELPILQAHGRYDRSDSIVLCVADYRSVYTKATGYLDLFNHLLTRERLVFVGFGFNDPWFQYFADRAHTLASTRELTAPQHIAVLGLAEEDLEDAPDHEESLRESLRARVLFYPIRNGSHEALGEVLDALLQETSPATKKAVSTKTPEKPSPSRPIPSSLPRPSLRDPHRKKTSAELEQAYFQRDTLLQTPADTTALDGRILDLKRQLRQGPQLHPGEFLADGRYQLIQTIGRGGFATVWLANDRQVTEQVAIKVLHGQFSTSEERRERLFRGARQMARLEHEHVVKVLGEPEVDDGWAFFVMEYLAGGDFRQAVLAGSLDLEARLRVLQEVADALDFAHTRQVIHRDVKPANILLDPEDHPRLTDFDLVRAEDTTGLTRTRAGMGSYLYAAPETQDDAASADSRCDVYSLAATTVFALLGQELGSGFIFGREAYLAQLGLDDRALEVLQRGLAVDPGERLASASELVRELRTALESADLPTASPSSDHTQREQPTRKGRANRPASARRPLPDSDLFRRVQTREGVVPLWCKIPAGNGWIGSPNDEKGRYSDEGPRHPIEVVEPFWMAAVAVTNRQYAAFDPKKGDRDKPNHPVVDVSWDDAAKLCRWLAEEQGFRGARLPTEEEWEYACRAGTTTRYWKGDDEKDLDEVGWYTKNSNDRTHAVGEKLANPWGLYDVHGNVWEWTASLWKANYSKQAKGLAIDPAKVPADLAELSPRTRRVIRGGGYWDDAQVVRSACRGHWDPRFGHRFLGFRVLLPFAPSEPRAGIIES